MQTFMPYPNIYKSLSCLDKSRLGNQVYREGLTLLRGGWKNHPAYKMWKDHPSGLAMYIWVGLDVLKERGLIYDKHREELLEYLDVPITYPSWIGDERVHSSHRSNLLRKDKVWYFQFGWAEPDDMPYYWPV